MNKKSAAKKLLFPICAAVILLCSLILIATQVSRFGCTTTQSSSGNAVAAVTDNCIKLSPIIDSQVSVPDIVTIQMGGDILLHDSVRNASSNGDGTYNLAPYFDLFGNVFVSDLNIVNLEGPTDAFGNNKLLSGFPAFNMPYEILPVLKNANVDLCITANNHTCDMNFKGVRNTLANIEKAGMDHTGSYATADDSQKCYIVERNNIKIGVAAFASYTERPAGSTHSFCVNVCGKKKSEVLPIVKASIDELRKNGAEFIIIALHWGNEYQDLPTDTQREIAKELCEYGADVIMGSHSHCVQPIEILTVDRGGVESNALVIYSLGNLFTNQSALNVPKTQDGMIVSVKAVRGEDGIVRLYDSFYMPTFTYVNGKRGDNFMRITASGEYAFSEQIPKFLKAESDFSKFKESYNRTTATVGNAIPVVNGPSSYPEGFFAKSN